MSVKGGLARSAGLIRLATLASRLLGVVREITPAHAPELAGPGNVARKLKRWLLDDEASIGESLDDHAQDARRSVLDLLDDVVRRLFCH